MQKLVGLISAGTETFSKVVCINSQSSCLDSPTSSSCSRGRRFVFMFIHQVSLASFLLGQFDDPVKNQRVSTNIQALLILNLTCSSYHLWWIHMIRKYKKYEPRDLWFYIRNITRWNVLIKIVDTLTSLYGKSSISSMCMTCPILGRFWASGSTHRSATKRTLFNALDEGFSGNLGSRTPSEFRLLTIDFSQSTKLTWKISMLIQWVNPISICKIQSNKHSTNLSRRSAVVNRIATGNYLHNKNSKTIHITPLIQHPGAGIFRCNVANKSKTKQSISNLFFLRHFIQHH